MRWDGFGCRLQDLGNRADEKGIHNDPYQNRSVHIQTYKVYTRGTGVYVAS